MKQILLLLSQLSFQLQLVHRMHDVEYLTCMHEGNTHVLDVNIALTKVS